MTEEKAIATQEESSKQVPMTADKAEQIMLSEKLAMGANENMTSFTSLPIIMVHNNKTNKEFEVGDLVKSVRTQSEYENEKQDKPFKGVISKVRMYLKTKFKAKEMGAKEYISDEFEAFDDLITLKEKKGEGKDVKYEIVEQNNYKNLQDAHSSVNKYDKVEKELDLIYSLYVATDLDTPSVVKIICRGTSRSLLFDYMKEFSRKDGDHMSSHWTQFDTEMIDTNFRGEPLQNPVAAISFTKMNMMTLDEMRKAVSVQVALEKEFERFESSPTQVETSSVKSIEQPAPQEELPTINIDDDQPTEIPTVEDKKVDEVKLEDIPF
jgi:hypothetical protein